MAEIQTMLITALFAYLIYLLCVTVWGFWHFYGFSDKKMPLNFKIFLER